MLRSLRRAVAPCAAVLVALPLAVVGARADTTTYSFGVSGGLATYGSCDLSSYNGGTSGAVPANGHTHTTNYSDSSTASSSDASIKQAKLAFTAKTESRAHVTAHDMSAHLSASGVAKTQSTISDSSRCETSVSGKDRIDVGFTSPAGWVHTSIDSQTDGFVRITAALDQFGSSNLDSDVTYDDLPGVVSRDSYVHAADHDFVVDINPEASSTGQYFLDVAPPVTHYQASVDVAFFDLGQAHAAESGTGKKVVGLGGNVACSVRALPVYFQASADKVEFTVGGKKAGTYRHVKKGHGVTLAHVNPSGPSTVVKAMITSDHTTTTVTRTYYGCSA
jgi:hypothetical protein